MGIPTMQPIRKVIRSLRGLGKMSSDGLSIGWEGVRTVCSLGADLKEAGYRGSSTPDSSSRRSSLSRSASRTSTDHSSREDGCSDSLPPVGTNTIDRLRSGKHGISGIE